MTGEGLHRAPGIHTHVAHHTTPHRHDTPARAFWARTPELASRLVQKGCALQRFCLGPLASWKLRTCLPLPPLPPQPPGPPPRVPKPTPRFLFLRTARTAFSGLKNMMKAICSQATHKTGRCCLPCIWTLVACKKQQDVYPDHVTWSCFVAYWDCRHIRCPGKRHAGPTPSRWRGLCASAPQPPPPPPRVPLRPALGPRA